MKVLITGITGFVGSHLAEYLLSKDVEVWGTKRWRSKLDNIATIVNDLNLIDCDIKDSSSVDYIIKQIKPDKIFHLAAQSYVPTSWNAPAETLSTNIMGQLNILEACRRAVINPVIQIACSSEEYGLVKPNEVPISELNYLRPLSPYGVSKVGQDLLGYQYAQSYGMNIIRTRAFNHTGPRRGDVFVESNFAKQIAMIEKKKQEPIIYVGNLEAQRDYTDVRDMVNAYWLATEKCEPGEVYNICSGKTWTIKSVLDLLLSYTTEEVTIEQDSKRLRPSDVEILLGNNVKFMQATNWQPVIKFEQTLLDLLNYWRELV